MPGARQRSGAAFPGAVPRAPVRRELSAARLCDRPQGRSRAGERAHPGVLFPVRRDAACGEGAARLREHQLHAGRARSRRFGRPACDRAARRASRRGCRRALQPVVQSRRDARRARRDRGRRRAQAVARRASCIRIFRFSAAMQKSAPICSTRSSTTRRHSHCSHCRAMRSIRSSTRSACTRARSCATAARFRSASARCPMRSSRRCCCGTRATPTIAPRSVRCAATIRQRIR